MDPNDPYKHDPASEKFWESGWSTRHLWMDRIFSTLAVVGFIVITILLGRVWPF